MSFLCYLLGAALLVAVGILLSRSDGVPNDRVTEGWLKQNAYGKDGY